MIVHLLLAASLLLAPRQDAPEALVLKGARIVPVSGAEVEAGTLVVEAGRIRRVGTEVEAPAGAKVIELPRTAWVLPGFIDVHSHLGSAFEVEEPTEAVTPQVKAVEAFTSRHRDVEAALGSGVTTVALAPGNGNLVGGRVGLVRLNGERYDRALWKDDVALKVSLGDEALRRDREPTSKTGAVRLLRELLRDPDAGLQGRTLLVHARSAGEIQSALELRETFRLPMVLLHAQHAGPLAERIRAAGVAVAVGPLTVNDTRETLSAPGKLALAGVRLAFASDAPATSEEQLRVSAAFAVKYGLDRTAALRALTLWPAELLGVAEEAGSLEEGRRADLVVWSGDPLSLASDVELVVAAGRVVYRRQEKP